MLGIPAACKSPLCIRSATQGLIWAAKSPRAHSPPQTKWHLPPVFLLYTRSDLVSHAPPSFDLHRLRAPGLTSNQPAALRRSREPRPGPWTRALLPAPPSPPTAENAGRSEAWQSCFVEGPTEGTQRTNFQYLSTCRDLRETQTGCHLTQRLYGR